MSSQVVIASLFFVACCVATLVSVFMSTAVAWTLLTKGLILVTVIALVVMFYMVYEQLKLAEKKQQALRQEIEQEKQTHNQKTKQLISELNAMANGDLSLRITAQDALSRAVSDAMHFLMNQLENLLKSAAASSTQLVTSTQNIQGAVKQMSESFDYQSLQMKEIAMAVQEASTAMDDTTTMASQSAVSAENSVSLARQSIDKMKVARDEMLHVRDYVQDSSKRLKRLSESSQEIGDVVLSFSDIADQTNILALNAAIQASMAGESGRGFAIVADEVQRLAERITLAIKQVENLVKTIQMDTSEAIVSMEKTITEIVQGVQFVQDSSESLDNIEHMSRESFDSMKRLAESARRQLIAINRGVDRVKSIQEVMTQSDKMTVNITDTTQQIISISEQLKKISLQSQVADKRKSY